MKIIQYNSNYKQDWNAFVVSSKNGTFMLQRDYMDYHSDRFIDHSLMLYDDKEKLVAVLPANIKDDILYSHQGLTYGGLIYNKKIRLETVIKIFEHIIQHCKINEIKQIVYKKIPYFYHTYPADEDRYAMFLNNFAINRVDTSSTIYLPERIRYSDSVKSGLRKAQRSNIIINYDTDNYTDCFNLINSVLTLNHNTSAVHTAMEMQSLKQQFPDNIKLVSATYNNKVIACIVLYITDTTHHTQYLASNEEGRNMGALDMLIDYSIEKAKESQKEYFDFGISNENNGKYLNQGLQYQKERFGGRCICHEFFTLLLK